MNKYQQFKNERYLLNTCLIQMSSVLNSSSATRDAMEAMQVVEEIANLLNTGLDKETLSICVRLIENGINPTVLAHAIIDTQQEAKKLSRN